MSQVAVVERDAVVASMSRARTALAEAKTIQATKKIVDVAAAAEIYARRQQLGDEAESLALAIKIEALRKLGEMLQSTPKSEGRRLAGRDSFGGTKTEPPKSEAPTLADMGLTKKESAVAQKLAAMPEKQFEQVRDGHVTVSKAIAAVDSVKAVKAPAQPPPAADPMPDGPSLEELIDELQAENTALQAVVKAAQADDLKAEAMKWRRVAEQAQRRQSELMQTVADREKELQQRHRILTRICKAAGEQDPSKVAAVVEAFYRQHTKAAA